MTHSPKNLLLKHLKWIKRKNLNFVNKIPANDRPPTCLILNQSLIEQYDGKNMFH